MTDERKLGEVLKFGTDRYDVKAAAGWLRVRQDGSHYDRATDAVAGAAEALVGRLLGVEPDTRALLDGDPGYDLDVPGVGRVDVMHAGLLRDGSPRPGMASWVIINPGSKKLTESQFLVYTEGLPEALRVVGWCPMTLFVRRSSLRDFGFGEKWAIPADWLYISALSKMAAYREHREDVVVPTVFEIPW